MVNPHNDSTGVLFACDMGFEIIRSLVRHRVFPNGTNTHDQTPRLCPEIQDHGQLLGREVLLGWRFTVRGEGCKVVSASWRYPGVRELLEGGTLNMGKHGRDCSDQGIETTQLALAIRRNELEPLRKGCFPGFPVAVLFFLLRVASLLSRGRWSQ